MEYKFKRVIMALIGVFLTGMSIAIFKTANLGTDPFTCLNLGIWNILGISYSIEYTIVTGILLVAVFVTKKHYIGIATIMNVFFLGGIAEECMKLFGSIFPRPELQDQLILLIIAVTLMCFSASLYFTADLGVSAYDAWALILSDHKIASFQVCRIGTDIVCVIVGAFMGISPGIGTLITAFGMGPLISFFNNKFSIPLLKGYLFRGWIKHNA